MKESKKLDLAVRLYRKVYSYAKKPVVSYLVITGKFESNTELREKVEKDYPGWEIDQVALMEK